MNFLGKKLCFLLSDPVFKSNLIYSDCEASLLKLAIEKGAACNAFHLVSLMKRVLSLEKELQKNAKVAFRRQRRLLLVRSYCLPNGGDDKKVGNSAKAASACKIQKLSESAKLTTLCVFQDYLGCIMNCCLASKIQ